jgi:hypothetical protein
LAAARVLADFEKAMERGVKGGDCEETPGIRSLLAWAQMAAAGIPSKTAFDLTVLNGRPIDDSTFWGQQAAAIDPHTALEKALAGTAGGDDDQQGDELDRVIQDQPKRSGFTPLS